MELSEIKIGKKVNYYPIIKDDGTKLGKKETVITSEAWKLGHGSLVCKVDGVSGSVLITHLEIKEETIKEIEYVIHGQIVFKEMTEKTKLCKHKIIAKKHDGTIYRYCEKCGIYAHADGDFSYTCGREHCRCLS